MTSNPRREPPADGPTSLGRMLRSLRERALLTQEELARRSQLSVGAIAGLESGRTRRPRGGSVRLLADALALDSADRAAFVEAARRASAEPDPTAEPVVVPAQLPGDLAEFAGRARSLERLDELLLGEADAEPAAAAVAVIAGTAGIGKSTLAVHWAHRMAGRFGDGQLYANLRGFDPVAEPVDPTVALRGFLEALGVPPDQVPPGLAEQVGRYRSLLTGRRVLVVLDNARDSEQVQPLLPGSPGCVAVVTSRNQLSDLVVTRGARPLRLDLLSKAEARQLLARRLGPYRALAEPAAVDEIISRCAGLPLALAIVAARAVTYPDFPLRVLSEQLRDASARLDGFAGGEPGADLRVVFSWSYQRLDPAAARLFRLLGVPAGPDIGGGAAVASLAGVAPAQARALLGELVRAGLVSEHAPGRYRLHDLLRTYATELSHAHDPEAERRAAHLRLLDYYLHCAYHADRRTNPHRDPIDLPADGPPRPIPVERFPTDPAAVDWLGAEYPNLLASIEWAATAGYDRHCWPLAWALDTFLDRRGDWRQMVSTWQIALDTTRRTGDRETQAYAYRRLGYAQIRLGRHVEGHTALHRALDLYLLTADHAGQAHTHHVLALQSRIQGDYRLALDHAQQALALFQSAGHHRGQAAALNSVGWYLGLLGDHDEALAHCQQALARSQHLDDRYGQAHAWDNLGTAHHRAGQYDRATDCLHQAAELFHALGERYYVAATTARLGEAYHASGDPDAAHDAWRHALHILDELGHPTADQLRERLADQAEA